jgi:hypothetical protein
MEISLFGSENQIGFSRVRTVYEENGDLAEQGLDAFQENHHLSGAMKAPSGDGHHRVGQTSRVPGIKAVTFG